MRNAVIGRKPQPTAMGSSARIQVRGHAFAPVGRSQSGKQEMQASERPLKDYSGNSIFTSSVIFRQKAI
jgi:hypothetical protein